LIDCFLIVLPQKKTEKEPRGRTKEWLLVTVGHQKKEQGKRQEAMALACDRSVYGSIGRRKRRERRPLAINRLILFSIVLPKNKTEKEPRGRKKEWPLARVGHQQKEQGKRQEVTAPACGRSIYGSIVRNKRREKGPLAIDCFFERLATKKNREGADRPNKRMAACDGRPPKKVTRQEPRGKRRRLAIDRSMDRSAAKKEEKKGCLRRSAFDRLETKKNEKEPIGRSKEWLLATVGLQKK